jgi:hypothetical protein
MQYKKLVLVQNISKRGGNQTAERNNTHPKVSTGKSLPLK